MPPVDTWALFAGAALLMALTPGPNMVYLLSRSVCQGTRAGVTSWLGVALGFSVHMLSAVLGLTALFMAVPLGYDLLRAAGALYLLWLAWQALLPGAPSPLVAQALPAESAGRLFTMGLLTSILNPKVALFYLSVLPQFINPAHGSVLGQSLALGLTQVAIGAGINLLVVLGAARLSAGLQRRPRWLALQRHVMGVVLAGLGLRLLLVQRQAG